MTPHTNGYTSGKSQFLFDVDANKATLDAATYADKYNLWTSNSSDPSMFSSKAKVPITNGYIGVTGNGQIFIEQKLDMFMEVREIHKREITMKDLLSFLENAKKKKIYQNQKEFKENLREIEQFDSSLTLNWDDGAGEEWAGFHHKEYGNVYMTNTKIGIIFALQKYEDKIPRKLLEKYEIIIVENYNTREWFVDIEKLKVQIPEICWLVSNDIINPKKFNLQELYFATV